MDAFAVFVFATIALLVLVFLALGRWYPGSGADQVGWRPTRSPELEAELELDDIGQMLEAQNERRRASGRAELTEEAVRDQLAQEDNARRARSEGPPPQAP